MKSTTLQAIVECGPEADVAYTEGGQFVAELELSPHALGRRFPYAGARSLRSGDLRSAQELDDAPVLRHESYWAHKLHSKAQPN